MLDKLSGMYSAYPERRYPATWRVALAFTLVPGVAAFLMAFLMPAYAGLTDPWERVWRTAIIFASFGAYPAGLTIGVPAYLMLRRHFEPTLLNCVLAGAVIAALPWLGLSLLGTAATQASVNGRATVIDGHTTAFGWFLQLQSIAEIAAFGAIGGGAFWVIAVAGGRAGRIERDEALID